MLIDLLCSMVLGSFVALSGCAQTDASNNEGVNEKTVATEQEETQEEVQKAKGPAEIKKCKLGNTKNVHQAGKLIFAGQFTKDDIAKIKEAKIKRVITLRTDGEIDWDEKAALKKAGLDLIEVPFRGPDTLTDEVFDKIRKLLKDNETLTLFHCGSANRVGGVWIPYRVLDEGVDLETAIKEAKEIGLRNPGYQKRAIEYIKLQKKSDG